MSEDSKKCRKSSTRNTAACGGGFYGLGFIGAAIYFISNVATLSAGVVGFLKALFWPAFLVYYAFRELLG